MIKWYQILFFIINVQIYCGYRDLIILIDWQKERASIDLNLQEPYTDQSFSGFGPNSSSFVTALAQKAAPILISSVTWKNFVERKQIFTDFITLSESELIKKYKNRFVRFNTDQAIKNFQKLCHECIKPNSTYIDFLLKADPNVLYEIMGFIIPYVTKFYRDEWITRKIMQHWYLLIPKNYLEKVKKDSADLILRKNKYMPHIADDEIALGLKLGNELKDPLDYTKHDDNLSVAYETEFLTAIDNLFITFNDIKIKGSKEKTEKIQALYMHDWYFYLGGHGGFESATTKSVITGLHLGTFQKVLTFFNNKIKTDFLFYSTCYAGGQHLKLPYSKTWYYPLLNPTPFTYEATRDESFNYIIVANTLLYAATYSSIVSINVPFQPDAPHIYYGQHFVDFFQEIKNYVHPKFIPIEQWIKMNSQEKRPADNLAKILNKITIFLTETGEIDEALQIPVIRFPTTEWFSVINVPNKIFNLTRTLAEVRAAEGKDIVIKDKEVVILSAESRVAKEKIDADYHNEILTSVNIEKEKSLKSPIILSNASDNAVYYFEQIKAPHSGIIELVSSFIPQIDEPYWRQYYIKKLYCNNDIKLDKQNKALGMAYGQTITLENVIISFNAPNIFDKKSVSTFNGIFFSYPLTNYYYSSFWEPSDKSKFERLKNMEFPGLLKIPKSIAVPQYPYSIPENRIKIIADVLEKKLKEQKAGKGSLVELQQELVYLTQSFDQLHLLLTKLKSIN